MTDLTILLLSICVSTWRLSYMLLYEEGPFDCFTRLRHWIGLDYDAGGNVTVYRDNNAFDHFITGLFTCMYCMSIWVGALLSLPFSPTPLRWIFNTLVASTVAIFINKAHNNG